MTEMPRMSEVKNEVDVPMPFASGGDADGGSNDRDSLIWGLRPKQPSVRGAELPRFQLATPYGHDLNENGLDTSLAPRALHELRTRYEDLRTDSVLGKGVVGMTVFGSMVKGGAKAAQDGTYDSDVDAYIFRLLPRTNLV